MKKLSFLLGVLAFVSILFIGCPPHICPPKPPTEDTINTPVTIITPPEDSLYNYISESYFKNYFPFDTGTIFLFVCEGEDRVDSLFLTLQFNEIERYLHRSDCLAPKQNTKLSDDDSVDTCHIWYTLEEIYYTVRYNNLFFQFFIQVSAIKEYPQVMVDYSFQNPYSSLNSGGNFCECDCKECISETCFPAEINVYHNDDKEKICLVIEQGKGITQFLGEIDKMWRLDSIIE